MQLSGSAKSRVGEAGSSESWKPRLFLHQHTGDGGEPHPADVHEMRVLTSEVHLRQTKTMMTNMKARPIARYRGTPVITRGGR